MKMKFFILAGGLALGASLLSTTSAEACSCTGAISATRAAVNSQGRATQAEIRQVQSILRDQTQDMNDNHEDLKDHLDIRVTDLIEALKGQSRENSNYQQMQVEAAQRIEDAHQVNATQRLRDEFRAKAESGENDPNPFSCLILDLFGNGSSSTPDPNNTGSAVVRDIVNFVDGDDPIVQTGGVRMAASIAKDKDDYEDFMESKNASTDWSLMMKEPSIDMEDPKVRRLAEILVRNTINTSPERSVPDAEKGTPQGLGRIAKLEETRARYKAALESIAMQLNMRTSVMEGEAVEKYRTMARDSAYNREIPNRISELQQIDIMTVWNYAPKGKRAEDLINGAKLSEKAWLFELHRIMSLNTRINYLNLEMASRDAVVNAAILATLNDDD